MQDGFCYREINEKAQRVDDRGNERARHNCRVKAELLRQHRQRAADELRRDDSHHKSYRNDDGDRNRNCRIVEDHSVDKLQLSENDYSDILDRVQRKKQMEAIGMKAVSTTVVARASSKPEIIIPVKVADTIRSMSQGIRLFQISKGESLR